MSQKEVDYFSDVGSQSYFYAADGTVLKNLPDLVDFLYTCEDAAYQAHVQSDRNDISCWVRDVFHDSVLANDLDRLNTRHDVREALKQKLENVWDFRDSAYELTAKAKKLEVAMKAKLGKLRGLVHDFPSDVKFSHAAYRTESLLVLLGKLIRAIKDMRITDENETAQQLFSYSKDLAEIGEEFAQLRIDEIGELGPVHTSDIFLLDLMQSVDALLGNKQGKMEQDILSLKKEVEEMQVANLSDHQEIKSTFLTFEKAMEYRFLSLIDEFNAVRGLASYADKIKRHTVLITAFDRDLFEIKKRSNLVSENVKSLYALIKEMSSQFSTSLLTHKKQLDELEERVSSSTKHIKADGATAQGGVGGGRE